MIIQIPSQNINFPAGGHVYVQAWDLGDHRGIKTPESKIDVLAYNTIFGSGLSLMVPLYFLRVVRTTPPTSNI